MAYLMGIDLGTSSVKVLIADEKGKIKGIGQAGYEVKTPCPGYAQQDPGIWWERTKTAIRECLRKSGILPEQIKGVGLSGQMHGLVALDREGRVIGSSLIHLDQRSVREKEEILEAAGALITEELMNCPGTGMLICSLLWLKRNCPSEYERIHTVFSPKDYIRYQLIGEKATDYCDASATLAFDIKHKKWCKTLIRRLDLKEDVWSSVMYSHETAGEISGTASKETGLCKGTKVVVGTGDCASQLIGNGVTEEGIISCNIGTSSQLAAVTKASVLDEEMRLQFWCHGIPDTYIFQGGAMNGGNTLNWFRNKVLKTDSSFEMLDKEAGRISPGCDGLFFLPYLAGERTPWNDPKARGVFFGMGLIHDQAAMIRAVMEGVIYNLKVCKSIFDQKGICQKRLISSGGGARGETWRQIQADVFDMPVYTTEVEEEACLGAAILAAVGTGVYGFVSEACEKMVSVCSDVTEPIRTNVRYYRERQELFCELYESVKGLYCKL